MENLENSEANLPEDAGTIADPVETPSETETHELATIERREDAEFDDASDYADDSL